MVCISCIVIPLVLYIWHKFLQPIALKIWNPWAKVEDQSQQQNETKLSCPISKSSNGEAKTETASAGSKKDD